MTQGGARFTSLALGYFLSGFQPCAGDVQKLICAPVRADLSPDLNLSKISRTVCGMKTVSISEAQTQLPQLIAQALGGDIVVLADGDKQVRLEPYNPADPHTRFDPDEDSAELEEELLKAVRSPHGPYTREELRAVADRALREHRSGKTR